MSYRGKGKPNRLYAVYHSSLPVKFIIHIFFFFLVFSHVISPSFLQSEILTGSLVRWRPERVLLRLDTWMVDLLLSGSYRPLGPDWESHPKAPPEFEVGKTIHGVTPAKRNLPACFVSHVVVATFSPDSLARVLCLVLGLSLLSPRIHWYAVRWCPFVLYLSRPLSLRKEALVSALLESELSPLETAESSHWWHSQHRMAWMDSS